MWRANPSANNNFLKNKNMNITIHHLHLCNYYILLLDLILLYSVLMVTAAKICFDKFKGSPIKKLEHVAIASKIPFQREEFDVGRQFRNSRHFMEDLFQISPSTFLRKNVIDLDWNCRGLSVRKIETPVYFHMNFVHSLYKIMLSLWQSSYKIYVYAGDSILRTRDPR